jgi:MarR family transcriptional regulator, organic hydroperoxide resistance regulator
VSKKQKIIEHITHNASEIFRKAQPGVPPELLSADITLSQFKVLLILYISGPRRMSEIAGELDVSLPTSTGVVDKLVNKDLVTRRTGDEDRRSVIVELSDTGLELVGKIWEMGRFKLEGLLEKLDESELAKAAEVTDIVLTHLKEIEE